MLLFTLWGCNDLKTELRPDSLLPNQLPDIQVPLDTNGAGRIDISTATQLIGSYSIRFGKPHHGFITVSGPDSNLFAYRAEPNYYGFDTAAYTIVKKMSGIAVDSAIGNLYFYRPALCQVLAVDDDTTFTDPGSGPFLLNILANDSYCSHFDITLGRAATPGGLFSVDNNNIVVYTNDKPNWTADSAQYTLFHNGLTSKAWVKVRHVVSPCNFKPKDDTVYYQFGQAYIDINMHDMLANDDNACNDLDRDHWSYNNDSTAAHYTWGVNNIQRPDAWTLRCIIDSVYENPGYIVYGAKRRQDPAAGSSYRYAHIYIKHR